MTILKSVLIFFIILLIFGYYKVKQNNIFLNYYFFDANGTTPPNFSTLLSYTMHSHMGNLSSSYSKNAKQLIKETKHTLNTWTNSHKYHTIFNSGASEGNNYILRSLSNKLCGDSKIEIPHFIISSYEHKTSITCSNYLNDCGNIEVSFIKPDIYGIIDPKTLLKLIKYNTRLISIMFINNEIGCKNNIEELGRLIHKVSPNTFFHSDAVQGIGKYKIDMENNFIDAISISMHKLYGLPGLGSLIISPRLCNELHNHEQISGTQFRGFRGGTENVAGIISANKSLSATFTNREQKNKHLLSMKLSIINNMKSYMNLIPYDIFVNQLDDFLPMHSPYFKDYTKTSFCILGPMSNDIPDPLKSSPNTIFVSFINTWMENYDEKICGIILKDYLYDNKIIVSIGSACNTESEKPSHVLNSINAPKIIRSSIIRISLMDSNTKSQCNYLCKMIKKGINKQLHDIKFKKNKTMTTK